MTGLLENKVGLVTGGNMGIGRACAEAMAREGAKVVVSARGEDLGRQVVEGIRASGGEATFVRCDVTDAAQVKALIDATISAYGRLDCAVNNAAYEGEMMRVTELPTAMWDTVLNTNVRGLWLCMKYEIPHMLKNGGSIVNLSSISAIFGSPTLAAYGASKFAVDGLTKSAALEYADKGIRINSVCPGGTPTAMLARIKAHFGLSPEEWSARNPMGRDARLEEMADPVVWLCSDRSSYVNGHAMVVDGAYSIK
ncbi:MAG: SDR family oxidoreductase [SAR202 cluster bacterium]|nr:SDR family oxidoreductase [SAR202 cluster bacterium]